MATTSKISSITFVDFSTFHRYHTTNVDWNECSLYRSIVDADCEGSAEIERTLSKTLANGKATPVDKIPTSWY